jgi:hypothetical protein
MTDEGLTITKLIGVEVEPSSGSIRRAPKVTVTRSGEKERVVAPKHLLPGPDVVV